jgi:mannose-6-phosphate isomerase-like protein (cupin superfamily)
MNNTSLEDRGTLYNPAIGHRVTFLPTAVGPAADLLCLEYVVDRQEEPLRNIPLHFHHVSEERFKVTAGRLGVALDKKTSREYLEPGQEITIPPDRVHAFWNAGDGELRFVTEIRPAGNFRLYWETVFGLAADGKVNDRGIPSALQVAVLLRETDVYAAGLPVGLQDALIGGLLGSIGRLLGHQARYARYSGPA